MTMFCQGKIKVEFGKKGVSVLDDTIRRILEARVRNAVRGYYHANGNKDEKMSELLECSSEFLAKGGTLEELESLTSGK